MDFRTTYRELSDHEKSMVADIKRVAADLSARVESAGRTADPRRTALAQTHLETAVMFAVKAITG